MKVVGGALCFTDLLASSDVLVCKMFVLSNVKMPRPILDNMTIYLLLCSFWTLILTIQIIIDITWFLSPSSIPAGPLMPLICLLLILLFWVLRSHREAITQFTGLFFAPLKYRFAYGSSGRQFFLSYFDRFLLIYNLLVIFVE